MTDKDERRVRKSLQGAEFPAHRETLVAYADERGASSKTLRALQSLPEGEYANTDAVEQAVPKRPEQTPGNQHT